MDASDRCRESIQSDLRRQAVDLESQASAKGARRAVAAATATEENAERRALQSGAQSIGRKLWRESQSATLDRRTLSRATASKYRKLASIDEMIAQAESEGWISAVGDGWRRGPNDPR